ncbi:MAG: O-antigen polymerase family protein [Candidatus Peregrinibacteria bacterium GW2011_GWF2_43_17]|nr:MAG: O-antigen polymerase family protein [Candidatus Peregrinibacteria bacterium GW2011_GWF2_43_17]
MLQIITTLVSAFILILIMERKPVIGLIIAIMTATLGELGRLPDWTNLPYLINDLFLPFLIFVWILKKIALQRNFKIPPLLLPILVWILIAALSLMINASWQEGVLYLVRFIEYFFLYLITVDEIKQDEKNRKFLFASIVIGALLVSFFGLLQLKYYPSFYDLNMMEEGWDPHINRLLSTWFDPNFVGGFLAFIICILFGIQISDKKFYKHPLLFISSLFLLFSLYLTYSRSAYLACGIGILVITALKSRKLFLLGMLTVTILFVTLGKAQERFLDLWESAKSILVQDGFNSYFNPDATSRLRVDSWQNALAIIKENFWFGCGYNAYKYSAWKLGMVADLEEHSSTGSDSSLLNIFATTGIFGFVAYLWFYMKALIIGFKNKTDGYNLGLTGALIALLAHATFVNSLLFPHMLVFFWISLGLLNASPNTPAHLSSRT